MSKNIVILHTIASLKRSSGGTSTVVPALCNHLGSAGASVFLLTRDWENILDFNIFPDPQYVQTETVRTFCAPRFSIVSSLFFSQTMTRLCRKQDIRIVHDNGLWLPSNYMVARVARRLRTHLIIQPHGMLEPWAMSFRAWKKKLAWKLYQNRDLESAALLVATSVQEAESIRKVGLRQPIAIIPNGIDFPEWKERTFPKERMRTALFLSRIHPIKGLMDLVAAWDRVRPEGWRIIVAGPDKENHRADVELAVRRAGLETDFQFIGPVEGEAKEKLYRDADLFILPTLSENFGIVVTEALACGTPVITTKGAPWQCLETYKCGWWIDIGVEPLVSAINEAINLSQAEREAMGLRGRQLVEQNYSWDKIGKEMLSVYEWVLGGGTVPECVMTD